MTDRRNVVEARFGGNVRLARPPVKEPTVTQSRGSRPVDEAAMQIAGSAWKVIL